MTIGTPTVQTYLASSQVSQAPYGWSTTAVTSSFTPPANCLLALFVATNRPTAADASLPSNAITDSVGLTWTRRAFKSSNAGSTGGAGQAGPSAELWTAPVGGSPTSMTVTSAYPSGANASSWNVGGIVASITDSGGSVPVVGAVAASSNASGTPTVSVASVVAGSQVLACAADWADITTAGTYSATYTKLNGGGTNGEHNSNYAYHYFCLASNSAGGTQAMTMSGPAGQNYDMVAIEIQVPPAAGANPRLDTRMVRQNALVRAAYY